MLKIIAFILFFKQNNEKFVSPNHDFSIRLFIFKNAIITINKRKSSNFMQKLSITTPISTYKIRLTWWFLILAMLTIYFKFNYLETIYREGFSLAIQSYLQDSSSLEQVKVMFLIFLKTFAEVSLLTILFYAILHKFMRLNLNIVIVLTILLIFLIGAANQLSLQNVRNLLSLENLMITFNWMKDNPDVINSYINKKNTFYFALSFLIAILPIFLSSKYLQFRPMTWLNTLLFFTIPIFMITSFSLYGSVNKFMKKDANLKPLDGYWSSIASSFISSNNSSLSTREVLPIEKLKENYNKLVYQKPYEEFNSSINVGKRHIIIIGLETAPEKYYPIINNPRFPNFNKMSHSSIVSNQHFTSSPYTFYVSYSILTGTYLPTNGSGNIYKDMNFNGLGNILSKNDYTPTYIDSYYVDWHAGSTHQKVFNRLGFNDVYDRGDYDYKQKIKTLKSQFEKELYAETKSFEQAIKSIDNAIENNKKSLLFISTSLGHFKWKATEDNKHLSNEDKILEIASILDNLIGKLLDSLKERNLENDVIIAITGDHGLRYIEEYTSLNEKDNNIAVSFNVPLMIYIPNALEKQIKLDYANSHIDLTPTLLELVGIDTSNYFFHGDNVLNPALKHRIIFMMNQSLKPENSFYKNNMFYTYNDLSAETFISEYKNTNDESNETEVVVKKVIQNAKEQFDDLGAYYLKHK